MFGLELLLPLLLGVGLLGLLGGADTGSSDDDDKISIDLGTAGDDVQKLSGDANTFDALGGNDNINAQGGDDNVNGGDGNDTLIGGKGNDLLLGGDGVDDIEGGDDLDIILAGLDDDIVDGGNDSDLIFGEQGDDDLTGGGDEDAIFGGPGEDTITGGDGGDLLDGGLSFNRNITFSEAISIKASLLSGSEEPDDELPDSLNNLSVAVFDDDEADVLDGGAGDDILSLGLGDTGTGGTGMDEFEVYTQAISGGSGGAAIITDYTDGDDTVDILYPDGDPTPTITIVDDGSGNAEVRADGVAVVILQGVAPGAVSPGDFGVFAFSAS